MRWIGSTLLLLGTLLAACGPSGQDPSPVISGQVMAPPGGSVQGTIIIACLVVGDDCDEDGSYIQEVTTGGQQAQFRFEGLERADYLLLALKDVDGDEEVGDGDYYAEHDRLLRPPAHGVTLRMDAIGDEEPEPGIEPGIVKGRVVTSDGRPVGGAEIIADNTLFYNTNVIGYTDQNGFYRLNVSNPVGTWQMFGGVSLTYDGQVFNVDLTVDDPSAFDGATGAIRDFTLSMRNLSGPVLIQTSIGDYTPYDEIEITATPVGPIIDGSDGETIVSGLEITGDGWAVRGVPFGRYRITARHIPTGEPMLVSRPYRIDQEYEWAESYTAGFTTPGLGIYELRAEVKRACAWPCE